MPKKQRAQSAAVSPAARLAQFTELTVNMYTTEIERQLGQVSKMCDDVRANLQTIRRLSIKRK